MAQSQVRQRTEGEGKEATHAHPAMTHAHDHYHVTHHHESGIKGTVGEFEHRAYWHTHEHNHAEMTHSHDYKHEDEDQAHGKGPTSTITTSPTDHRPKSLTAPGRVARVR